MLPEEAETSRTTPPLQYLRVHAPTPPAWQEVSGYLGPPLGAGINAGRQPAGPLRLALLSLAAQKVSTDQTLLIIRRRGGEPRGEPGTQLFLTFV